MPGFFLLVKFINVPRICSTWAIVLTSSLGICRNKSWIETGNKRVTELNILKYDIKCLK